MTPNILFAIVLIVACLQGVVLWVLMSTRHAIRHTAVMAAVHTHTNFALAALLAHRNDVEEATKTVLARIDHTARALVERREGPGYGAWVKAQVTTLSNLREANPNDDARL